MLYSNKLISEYMNILIKKILCGCMCTYYKVKLEGKNLKSFLFKLIYVSIIGVKV